jgi:HTH-type transcriptional regulator / antitoxin HigA
MGQRLRYQPDYAVTPGEILEEHLEAIGMTKAELALRCGRPMKTISEIIHGKAAITAETALQLERVLGRPASLWQNLEATYRLRLAERGETESLGRHASWAKTFPIRELVAMGALEAPADDSDLVKKLLRFLGVGSPAAWAARFAEMQTAYRRSPSFKAAPGSVAAWLRRGEIAALEIECAPFEAKAFKQTLLEVRALTAGSVPDVWDELVTRCRKVGVAVVVVPELPKTHLSGAARWLSKDKALIQLSLRHKRNDHFWFSFFHEAAHLLLHGKKTIFIDEKGGDHRELEDEANLFAGSLLIPPAAFQVFVKAKDFSSRSIQRFAKAQGIAPGIVVGRLQHERLIAYSMHVDLTEPLAFV